MSPTVVDPVTVVDDDGLHVQIRLVAFAEYQPAGAVAEICGRSKTRRLDHLAIDHNHEIECLEQRLRQAQCAQDNGEIGIWGG